MTEPADDNPGPIALAHQPVFRLGSVEVHPSTRQVIANGRSETLEPRVMQVLVALEQADGAIVTIEELIERCWQGVVVGDNAIHRVISRIRHLAADLADGSFQIETIAKVGYRLRNGMTGAAGEFRLVHEQSAAEAVSTPAPEPAADTPANAEAPFWTRKMTRRAAAGGIALLGGGALAYATLDSPARHVPDSRALDLYQRGQLTQKTGLPGTMRQAMSFYKQAVAIDPEYADAWAALAIGYRHGGDGFVKEPRSAYPRLVRSAAGRALALDPDNAEAHLALAVIDSDFGRWLEQEQRLRSIVRRFPNYWFAFARLDLLLQNVGRFEEGIAFRRRLLELEPMVPAGWAYLARGLHYAGRDHEADIALDEGFSRWPAHPFLWWMRYSVLVGGKRYADAAAFARDPRHLPEMFPKEMAEAQARVADALATRQAIDQMHAMLRRRPLDFDLVAFTLPIIAELGAFDLMFEALEAYFFGGMLNGQVVPPPEAQDARVTAVLFAPAVLALRGDPRHASLLKRSGLEDYWRKSGSQPDFRGQ